jgi:hypothetical protein
VKDEFQRWAAILASLSREEIVVLGKLHRFTSEALKDHPSDSTARTAQALSSARNALVGNFCLFGADGEAFEATVAGLVRTGLILPISGFGALSYKTTSLFDRLTALIEWEAFADEVIASTTS